MPRRLPGKRTRVNPLVRTGGDTRQQLRARLAERGEDPGLSPILVAVWCAHPSNNFGDSELERLAVEILESE
jgi:hypothetical protein